MLERGSIVGELRSVELQPAELLAAAFAPGEFGDLVALGVFAGQVHLPFAVHSPCQNGGTGERGDLEVVFAAHFGGVGHYQRRDVARLLRGRGVDVDAGGRRVEYHCRQGVVLTGVVCRGGRVRDDQLGFEQPYMHQVQRIVFAGLVERYARRFPIRVFHVQVSHCGGGVVGLHGVVDGRCR